MSHVVCSCSIDVGSAEIGNIGVVGNPDTLQLKVQKL